MGFLLQEQPQGGNRHNSHGYHYELADRAVKSAALIGWLLMSEKMSVVDGDIKAHLRILFVAEWQSMWTSLAENKLRTIKGNIRSWVSSCRNNRWGKNAITRIRISYYW